MIIKKFRVKNYKSIVDSGDCYLESDLTIFAGKNESGKSSLLEALLDFNIKSVIDEGVIPIEGDPSDLSISITFIIPIGELKSFFLKIKKDQNVQEPFEFTITKNYYDKYTFEQETRYKLQIDSLQELIEIKNSKSVVSEYYGKLVNFKIDNSENIELPPLFDLLVDDSKETTKSFDEYIEKFKEISDPLDDLSSEYEKLLELFKIAIQTQNKLELIITERYEEFLKILPNFVLFRSFEDTGFSHKNGQVS